MQNKAVISRLRTIGKESNFSEEQLNEYNALLDILEMPGTKEFEAKIPLRLRGNNVQLSLFDGDLNERETLQSHSD